MSKIKGDFSSFGELIWSSIFSISGKVSGCLTILLAIGPWLISPETVSSTVKFTVGILVFFFYLIILGFTCSWYAYLSLKDIRFVPKVVMTSRAPEAYKYGHSLLILEPTNLLSYDSLASVYYLRDKVEHLVSIGKVINVQEDDLVQLLLFHDKDLADIELGLFGNREDIKSNLIVKPSINYQILEEVRNNEW